MLEENDELKNNDINTFNPIDPDQFRYFIQRNT
jgi:hypothetical protein